MDRSQDLTWTIPAGGSQQIQIPFEGAGEATIEVVGDAPFSAAIGGTTIPADGLRMGLPRAYLRLSNPVDGLLQVTNTGTAPGHIVSIVRILTTRHLTIGPSNGPVVAKGVPVSLTFVVSDPVTGEAVSAVSEDPAGVRTPLTLVPAGAGHWTAQFSSTVAGEHDIIAETTGAGSQRTGTTVVQVLSGDVTLGSSFTERLDDTDGDGLANALVLSPTVTVTTAGTYDAVADLVDDAGTTIVSVTGVRTLVAGAQPLDLSFDAARIFANGRPGPYHLRNIYISGGNPNTLKATAADLGATQAYDVNVFQH
jgi:hypothetical protein